MCLCLADALQGHGGSSDDDDSEQQPAKKARSGSASSSKPKPRPRSKSRGSSEGGDGAKKELKGFAKPQRISDDLAAATGQAEMSRGSLTKWLYAYAKEKDLYVSELAAQAWAVRLGYGRLCCSCLQQASGSAVGVSKQMLCRCFAARCCRCIPMLSVHACCTAGCCSDAQLHSHHLNN
jgi:hypothetical protein